MIARLAAALSLAALAGCAAGSCDPSQAGFFSGIGCEASGAYGARNQMQRSALAQSRSQALQEEAGAGQAQSEAASAEASLNERRRQLDTLDRETASLRARLGRLRGSNRVDQGRLAVARAQLDELQRRRAALPASASEAQIEELERKRTALFDVAKGLQAQPGE
jgi:chromosome segregation ATPase